MNSELLVDAGTIATSIIKQESIAVRGFTFKPTKLRAKDTSTDGFVVECGFLRRGRYIYHLQISEERYAPRDAHFWYGAQASSKAALKNLVEDLQRRDTQVSTPLTSWIMVDKPKRYYRLPDPLPPAQWQKIIPEYYSEDSEWFLGVYLKPRSVTAQTLGEKAAGLWLDFPR